MAMKIKKKKKITTFDRENGISSQKNERRDVGEGTRVTQSAGPREEGKGGGGKYLSAFPPEIV